MPEQSEAQILGDAGENWFRTQLPPGWIPNPPERDVGVDFLVVICERGPLNGREFRVQIKTSKRFKSANGALVIPGVKRSTIDYWFISPVPTIVVAYDSRKRCGYYRWHSDFFNEISRLGSDESQRTVSLTIPTQNKLSAEAWDAIRRAILYHARNLRAALRDARDAKSVMPTIHGLASAVRELNSIDHQPIPESRWTPQQEGLLALMEMIQHREVIKTASRLMKELLPGSEGAKRLKAWIAEYLASVKSVFPKFDEMPQGSDIPLNFELVYARNRIHVVRGRLLHAVLDLILLLTPRGGDLEGDCAAKEAQGETPTSAEGRRTPTATSRRKARR